MSEDRAHRVLMFAYPDAQILDITGPLEVFGRTGRWLRDQGLTPGLAYEIEMVAAEAGPLRTSSGLELVARRSCFDADPDRVATFLITGGIGFDRTLDDPRLLDWLRTTWRRAPRRGSICTGALIAARAGLLEGPATTHWAYCDELAGSGVEVNADALFVKSGSVYTSAGVTAGMDMALAMVEEDWSQPVALAVAQELVLYLKRPGGQSQFSRLLASQMKESSRFDQLCLWIHENLAGDLSVPALARRSNLSLRHFSRRFSEEVGLPPGRIRAATPRRGREAKTRNLGPLHQGDSVGVRLFQRGTDATPLPASAARFARHLPRAIRPSGGVSPSPQRIDAES